MNLLIALLALVLTPAHADHSVDHLVSSLIKLVDATGVGRHGEDTATKESYSLKMVREYLVAQDSSLEDPEYFDEEYELVEWFDSSIGDQYGKAGTITLERAKLELGFALENWLFETPHWETAPRYLKDKVLEEGDELLTLMKKRGVYFGFDGSAQNGCAAPTQFLLVLDPKNRVAYGIDLNPCLE